MLDFLILYEHKVREMETVLLLQYELQRRGYSVDILNVYAFVRTKYVLWRKPVCIVVPFLYGDEELQRWVYNFCGSTRKVFNLQWEQVFNKSSDDDSRQTPSGHAREAAHLCWGEKSLRRLQRAGVANPLLLGHPGMDFLSPRFRGWYSDRSAVNARYGFPEGRRMIFFISSFSYVSCTDSQLAFYSTITDRDPFAFKALSVETRNRILEWFDRYLTECGEAAVVVYRPHPAELRDGKIDELAARHPSFYFIQDDSVRQWISVADVVLNWYSTSAVEACFAGKRSYFLRPVEIPDGSDYRMFDGVEKITGYQGFVSCVKQATAPPEHDALRAHVGDYYAMTDGRVYADICDVLVKMRESDAYDMKGVYMNRARVVKDQITCLLKRLMTVVFGLYAPRCLTDRKRIADVMRDYNRYKKEKISEADVRRFREKMAGIMRNQQD